MCVIFTARNGRPSTPKLRAPSVIGKRICLSSSVERDRARGEGQQSASHKKFALRQNFKKSIAASNEKTTAEKYLFFILFHKTVFGNCFSQLPLLH
jgi:hypothetical protein